MSVITTSTPIYPPPDSPRFAGFYDNGTGVLAFGCPTSYEFRTLSSTPAYGNCCLAQDERVCPYATRCSGNSAIYRDGSTSSCEAGRTCVEAMLYQEETSGTWNVTIPWCLLSDDPTVFYWTHMTTFTTTVDDESTTTPTSTSEPEDRTIPAANLPTEVPTTDASSPTPTETPDSYSDDDSSGTNVGAIAGGVVGGVAGLLLIVLAGYYIMRRHRKKSEELRELGAGYVAPTAGEAK